MADGKPLAWIGVFDGEPDPEFIWWDEAKARRWVSTRPGVVLAPLSIAPTLTDEEREAIERQAAWLFSQAKNRADIHSCDLLLQEAATLRGLLARSATSTT